MLGGNRVPSTKYTEPDLLNGFNYSEKTAEELATPTVPLGGGSYSNLSSLKPMTVYFGSSAREWRHVLRRAMRADVLTQGDGRKANPIKSAGASLC